jgi:hypothetical protein
MESPQLLIDLTISKHTVALYVTIVTRRGFGSTVELTGPLISAAASNYNTSVSLRNRQITTEFSKFSNFAVFTHSLLGNGFSQWLFLCYRAHVLTAWQLSHN